MPVAFEVARGLQAPLDVFLVRKLGVSGHRELALGAIASGGTRVLNEEVIAALEIEAAEIEATTAREATELSRRERLYRGDRAPLELAGRTVMVVDDGLATGATMRAAVLAIRAQQAARIVVAVPVAAPATCARLAELADRVLCAHTPEPFRAVSLWYRDFAATNDAEVRTLLEEFHGI